MVGEFSDNQKSQQCAWDKSGAALLLSFISWGAILARFLPGLEENGLLVLAISGLCILTAFVFAMQISERKWRFVPYAAAIWLFNGTVHFAYGLLMILA